jgi:opacity protein-like surface antigen
MRARLASILALPTVLWTSTAGATEDAWQFGLGGGYALALVDDQDAHGAALAADLSFGISEAWSARASGALSLHGGSGQEGAARASGLGLGATYAVDVVRWVPFLELGVAALSWREATRQRTHLGFGLGLGAEYLISPRWACALLLRYQQLPLHVSGSATPGTDAGPRLFMTTVRLGWTP